MRPRILIVEDEPSILDGLCDVLAFNGFDPVGEADGAEGLKRALEERFDLVILDVMLPGVDGLTICRRVREAWPGRAILMLTAKGSESDVLEGFSRGADDYVSKPFSVAQLTARVKALLRRVGGAVPKVFDMSPLRVDPGAMTVVADGELVEVTRRDIDVLAYLVNRRGQVVSREELLREVWGYQRVDRVETRCIDMHIVKLRKKLAIATPTAVITTVRGAGYTWRPPNA